MLGEKNQRVGQIIKSTREQQKLSQVALARKAGIEPYHLCNLEGGNVEENHIRWGTIRKLCDALHVTPNYLMGYAHDQ